MIFKTFNSDIDKWTAKIGIFGKSFNELGTAVNNAFKSTIDNLDNLDADISFWESLKNNLFSQKDSNKDWIKNSFGQIVSNENIDSYIMELDLDSSKEKLQEIFNWQEDINNGETTWNKYFDTCKNGNEYLIDVIKNTDDLSKLTGEDLVKANQAARKTAIAHNQALQQQTLGAKAGQAALKGLAMAGNMIAMWAVSQVISLVVKAFDNYINRVKYADEATMEAISNYESITSEVENLESKISELNEQMTQLDPLTDADDIANLQAETTELETQLTILREKQRLAGIEADEAAQKSLNMTQASKYKTTSIYDGVIGEIIAAEEVTKTDELQYAIDAYKEYEEQANSAQEAMAKLAEEHKTDTKEYRNYSKQLESANKGMADSRSYANDLANAINEQKAALTGDTEESKALINNTDIAINRYNEFLHHIDDVTNALTEQKEKIADISFLNFSDLFNTDSIDDTKQKLLDLSTAGELSEETITSTEEYMALLDQTAMSAKEFADAINQFNLQNLNDNYEYLIELLDRVRNGETLTFEEMTYLIAEHESLANAVIVSANGYSLEEDAVISLANEYAVNSNKAISNQVQTTKRTIEEIRKRIEAYKLEHQALLDSGIATAVTKTGRNYEALASRYGYTKEQVDEYYAYLSDQGKLVLAQQKLGELSGQLDDTLYQNISSSSASSPTSETFNWLETLISRIERRITNFGKTVSSVWKNWSDRNHAVVQEMSAINEEILIQQSAYDAYMAKAESVGLSSYYQALVQNGGFQMEDITDDTLKEQIKNYQEFYEKALACSDAVTDLRGDLADLAQTRFDNIAAQFNDQINLIEHESVMLESRLDQIQTKGYLAGSSYYTELIQLEQDNIAFLQGEYSGLTGSLQEALANGTVEQYSEQWYDMVSSINDVQEAIEDANSSLIDYQNNLRQLNWDIFDKTQEYISRIPSESGFLMDLMGNSDLYHENGTFNELGNAAAGLHAVNFNTYMAQADDYAKELLAIDKEISDDPYNTTLIERRQELLELQQDSIKAAEEEKQSMKDLVSDGYDVMLNALQKLIDKRKDAMQAEKDLYDYQKSIAEQTKTIAQYQKQLSAFSGDNSEETQAAIQKIKVSLEEAEQNLAESEYDQWLSDQEKMLDNLYDETEEWVNRRLDDLNGIILEIIDNTNANADSIKETLAAVGEDVGYSLTPEMEKIWTASDGISQVVSQYSNHFSSHATTVQAALSNIQSLIQQMAGASNATAAGDINGIKQNTVPVPNTSASAKPANTTGNSGLSAGVSSWGSWFISQKDSFDKSKLNGESSIVDRLKLRDFASDFQYRKNYYSAMGGTGTYTGSASQNAWMIAQMKAHGFQKGGIIGNAIHSAGEDGFILARTGEGILPVEMIPEWEEFISALPQLNSRNHFLLDIPKLPHYNPSANRTVNSGDVTLQIDGIQMYGVNDPEQFTNSLVDALSTNTRIRKVLVDNTIGVSLGKNSLLSRSR